MSLVRTILIWMLAVSLPVDALASVRMSHCKDMQQGVTALDVDEGMVAMDHGMAGHDHAAMMAEAASSVGGAHDHHKMAATTDADSDSSNESQALGCKCGCKCSGNCAVSCASMLVAITANHRAAAVSSFLLVTASAPRSQAHAAYRFDPLRPPSTVAS